jgi:hypothetical protein
MYKVYSGPPGTDTIAPLEKEHLLFKQFGSLDDALAWAFHLKQSGRVALLIEGDDGTHLTKREIAEYVNARPGLVGAADAAG